MFRDIKILQIVRLLAVAVMAMGFGNATFLLVKMPQYFDFLKYGMTIPETACTFVNALCVFILATWLLKR